MVAEPKGSISDTSEEGEKWIGWGPTSKEISMAVLPGNVIHEKIYLFTQVLA